MANVNFKRIEDSALINNYPVSDGSFWVTKDGKSYIDYDNDRVPIGGTPDSQMSDRSTNSVQNKIVKQYVDDSINNVNQITMKKVWENENPRTDYGANNVMWDDASDYDYLKVFYLSIAPATHDFSGIQSVDVLKGYNGELTTVFYNTSAGVSLHGVRSMKRVGDNTFQFTSCYAHLDSGGSPYVLNELCIPVQIMKVKCGKGLS